MPKKKNKKPSAVRSDPKAVIQKWLDLFRQAKEKGKDSIAQPDFQDACASMTEVIVRADRGDQTALPAIRKFCEEDAEFAITVLGGDLAECAERALVETITGKQLAVKEALLMKLNELRTELAGPNVSPIERLLVERTVACWLQMYHADVVAAQATKYTLREGDYTQRRQDRAHRRYMSALKTLAAVRRLELPIRVNVNVAGEIETKTPEPATPANRRWLTSQHN
jgi:hypothetical protein